MLIAYKIKKEGFSFEWQEFKYNVLFLKEMVLYYDENGEPVPEPPKKIIKRLVAMLPHYSWGNVAD